MNTKVLTYSVLFGLLSAAAFASQQVNEHKVKLPFLGQPQEKQAHVTEDGLQTFRLRRTSVPQGTQRKIKEVKDDNYGLEYSLLDQVKDFLLGKSEERTFWEEIYNEQVAKAHAKKKNGNILGTTYYDIDDTSTNTQYMMWVYCGSQQTPMNVTFDTGSSWLILQTTSCTTCTGSLWDYESSTTGVAGSGEMEQDYGSATTDGEDMFDQFYLDDAQSFGITSFEYMAITSGSGISPSGGIMGFSRTSPFSYNGSDYWPGPLFYDGLLNASVISTPVFSIYYADYPDQSFYTLGDYDTGYNYYNDDIIWLDVDEQMYWMTTVTAVMIGSKDYALSSSDSLIIDSGTSLAYMPSGDGQKIIKKILKGTGLHFKLYGTYFINCNTAKYDSVYFLIDGYWIEIPPETYVFDFGGRFCMLGFGIMDVYGYYLFGDVLLRNYYTVWDNEKAQVGFSPISGGYAGSITTGTLPKRSI